MGIDTMPAGRELDALVAERVMGLPVTWAEDPYREVGMSLRREGRHPWLKGTGPDGCHYDWAPVPRYSTDIAAAFAVVEALRAQWAPDPEPFYWEFQDCGVYGWVARIVWDHHDGPIVAFEGEAGERLPLAICRASLKLIGQEERNGVSAQ